LVVKAQKGVRYDLQIFQRQVEMFTKYTHTIFLKLGGPQTVSWTKFHHALNDWRENVEWMCFHLSFMDSWVVRNVGGMIVFPHNIASLNGGLASFSPRMLSSILRS
jgi:hypothetical protein